MLLVSPSAVFAPVQQLAAAKSDAEALRAERDQLAEVVLEMQVGPVGGWVAGWLAGSMAMGAWGG